MYKSLKEIIGLIFSNFIPSQLYLYKKALFFDILCGSLLSFSELNVIVTFWIYCSFFISYPVRRIHMCFTAFKNYFMTLQCITHFWSISLEKLRLIAIANWIFYLSDSWRLIIISLTYGLISLRYCLIDRSFIFITVTFIFNVIVVQKITYSYWFIIIIFLFENHTYYSVFDCFIFFL